jgi:hypothetical protein
LPVVVAVVEGRAEVHCSHCGVVRRWVAESGIRIRRRQTNV